jgi:hypothetical protein
MNFIIKNESVLEIPVEKNSALAEKFDQVQKGLPYQVEEVQGFYADELWQAMEHRGLNQVEFAQKADVTKQFLTKVFRAGNCTIETMVKLAFALDYKVSIHLAPNEVTCAWIHCINDSAPRPADRYFNLWNQSGYRPAEIAQEKFELVREKIAA